MSSCPWCGNRFMLGYPKDISQGWDCASCNGSLLGEDGRTGEREYCYKGVEFKISKVPKGYLFVPVLRERKSW